jgi:hypothetical protein
MSMLAELIAHIKNGDEEAFIVALDKLLSAPPSRDLYADNDRRNLLHWACLYNHAGIVALLLRRPGLGLPDAQDAYKKTPLRYAIEKKHIACCLTILNQSEINCAPITRNLLHTMFANDQYALYEDKDGYYKIGTSIEAMQSGIEHLALEKKPKKTLSVTFQANDEDLVLKLIDKYLYKKTRLTKLDRDEQYSANPNEVIKKRLKANKNLNVLKSALQILKPDLDIKQLSPYLEKAQRSNKRYYGDDLSDNSDSEDDRVYQSELAAKINSTHQRIASKHTRPFWQRTRRETPKNSGLNAKIKILVDKIKKNISDDAIINEIKGIKTVLTEVKLQERAIIPAGEVEIKLDAAKHMAELNQLRSVNKKWTQQDLVGRPHFFIAQYRGINYMQDRWNADARRYHRKLREENLPQYSEMVLMAALPYDIYVELNEAHDFTKNPDDQASLYRVGYTLKEFLGKLNHAGPCIDFTDEKKAAFYLFNSIGDRWQHRFSNGINSHLTQIQQLRQVYPDFWGKHLPNAYNPAIAEGDRPYHAEKYTLGLKPYYPYPFDVRYHNDGTLEYLHTGKLYISLHTLEELISGDSPNRVSEMDKAARIILGDQIAPEKETSYNSFIPAGKVFFQMPIKYPSFRGGYKQIYAVKYGFDRELYEAFQQLIAITQINMPARNAVINLLAEWLCAYYEVLLIDLAREEANKRNGILVYLNNDGQLSFEPDKGRLFTAGENNSETRNTVHIHRTLRKCLATQMKNSSNIPKDTSSFPGFTLISQTAVNSAFTNVMRSDTHLKALRAVVKLNKNQEREGVIKKTTPDSMKTALVKQQLTYIRRDGLLANSAVQPEKYHRPLSIAYSGHLYMDTEMNALLTRKVKQPDGSFSARIYACAMPCIQGTLAEQAKKLFIADIEAAFKPGVTSVIPINVTTEKINTHTPQQTPGTHWVGLVIRPIDATHFQVEWIDPLNSSAELAHNPHAATIHQLILTALADKDIHIEFSILPTQQQRGDVDCGPWTVDNLIRRINNHPIRTRDDINGIALRQEHADYLHQEIMHPARYAP